MQYRKIQKTGDEISPIGFGAMRLSLKNGKIDRKKASKLIYHAIDNGVNFIDTAYLYGDSESFLGEILQGEYKDKVKLCTKLPTINVRKYEDMENILEEQLNRLQRDSIDYYLMHAVDLKSMNRLIKRDLFKFISKAKSEGKIKHVGFSYHGPKEEFPLLIDGYDWDVVMVQYNYFDENVQASVEGIEYAASKGMGVLVMEPLKGGILAGKMPKDAEEIFKKADPDKSTAEWAFEWVLNNRNVTCVLSGMNSFEQLNENLAVAERTTPLSMSFEEMETVELVNNEKYLFDHKGMFNQSFMDYYQYVGGIMGSSGNAGKCNGCGKCLRKCPQKLDIIEELKKVKKEFEIPGYKFALVFVQKVGFPIYRFMVKLLNR